MKQFSQIGTPDALKGACPVWGGLDGIPLPQRSMDAVLLLHWGKAFVLTGLILMLGGAPSWGAPPNNDASDAAGNTAGGTGALQNNILEFGTVNTAYGFGALQNNSHGDANTASGVHALYSTTGGMYNTASGFEALFNNTEASVTPLPAPTRSTAPPRAPTTSRSGMEPGGALTSGSNNIYLGNSGGSATESDTMRLGGGQTRTFIAGIAGVSVSGSAVLINSTGQMGIQASSSRYKYDIQPMGTHSRGLHQLRPVIFRYKDDAQGERQYGLIAEEVAQVYPELVTRGASGEVEAVRYHEIIPMLLNEVQHQQRQVATLKAENARLRAVVAQQQERDAALAARLERLEAAVARAATLASR
jgi:endosialidase-like protein